MEPETPFEDQLRLARPQPRQAFVDATARRLAHSPLGVRSRRLRLAVVAIITAALLAAVGALGGLSYAASGLAQAGRSAQKLVRAQPVRTPRIDSTEAALRRSHSSAGIQYGTTVEICHLGNTILVDSTTVNARLARGDTLGKCRTTAAKKKAKLCEKGKTVLVSPAAIKSRLAHGATRGTCRKGAFKPPAGGVIGHQTPRSTG